MKQVNCIMLIDDNKIDNFFHERVIKRNHAAKTIITKESGQEALDYLMEGTKQMQPDVIFLDINMPGMNGWEFLEHYKKLNKHLQTAMVVVMLSTSENPDDRARAKTEGILSDYKSKPLTKEMLEEVLEIYISAHTGS
jgi:CheY-like chemotaxis protein